MHKTSWSGWWPGWGGGLFAPKLVKPERMQSKQHCKTLLRTGADFRDSADFMVAILDFNDDIICTQ